MRDAVLGVPVGRQCGSYLVGRNGRPGVDRFRRRLCHSPAFEEYSPSFGPPALQAYIHAPAIHYFMACHAIDPSKPRDALNVACRRVVVPADLLEDDWRAVVRPARVWRAQNFGCWRLSCHVTRSPYMERVLN